MDIYSLHRGRSRKILGCIIPDGHRIEWPDIGLSDLTNLTRVKAAALEWAEQKAAIEDRKKRGVGALKSLRNFSWSSSPMRLNEQGGTETPGREAA
jgi:hypothetical protein